MTGRSHGAGPGAQRRTPESPTTDQLLRDSGLTQGAGRPSRGKGGQATQGLVSWGTRTAPLGVADPEGVNVPLVCTGQARLVSGTDRERHLPGPGGAEPGVGSPQECRPRRRQWGTRRPSGREGSSPHRTVKGAWLAPAPRPTCSLAPLAGVTQATQPRRRTCSESLPSASPSVSALTSASAALSLWVQRPPQERGDHGADPLLRRGALCAAQPRADTDPHNPTALTCGHAPAHEHSGAGPGAALGPRGGQATRTTGTGGAESPTGGSDWPINTPSWGLCGGITPDSNK